MKQQLVTRPFMCQALFKCYTWTKSFSPHTVLVDRPFHRRGGTSEDIPPADVFRKAGSPEGYPVILTTSSQKEHVKFSWLISTYYSLKERLIFITIGKYIFFYNLLVVLVFTMVTLIIYISN